MKCVQPLWRRCKCATVMRAHFHTFSLFLYQSNSLACTWEAESRIDERPGLDQSSDESVEISFELFNGFFPFWFRRSVSIAHGKAQAALVAGSGRGLVGHFLLNDKETKETKETLSAEFFYGSGLFGFARRMKRNYKTTRLQERKRQKKDEKIHMDPLIDS